MITKHLKEKVVFTKEMKKTHTILIPAMLPIHFEIIAQILKNDGYNVKLLNNNSHSVIEAGLKNIHNDTCYPAQLVIGQLIDALENSDIPKDKIALLITQTGGGCRASNYIHLLRKALRNSGYENVPVISLGFVKGEKNEGFSLSPLVLLRCIYGVYFGDLIMTLYHQCKPYEINELDSDKIVEKSIKSVSTLLEKNIVFWREIKKLMKQIINNFENMPKHNIKKPRVGIVGEIYVKYSPLGNNNLEEFLLSEGCEIVSPGLLDFLLYCIYNYVFDYKIYGFGKIKAKILEKTAKILCKKKIDMINLISNNSDFMPPCDFEKTIKATEGYIGLGCKMGEGWLLTAEMVELIQHQEVNNIVCTQPFGCLPNHIAGKGVIRIIKEKNPNANIVAIDYDSGASAVNQQNRIKLMLANMKLSDVQTEYKINFNGH